MEGSEPGTGGYALSVLLHLAPNHLFVDFRKAFDLVDHAILLTKLADMGVSRNFWRWTQSFLSNRTLQVKLPGVTSRIGHVVAGVPQGGVLSPTLFNVHINDIEVGIQGDSQITTCKYADDCTMYQLVPVDTETHMHHAMHHLESWATENKMELNAKKTKEMWISFKKSGNQPPPLRINNVELERVEEFKLLGVIVQDDLKWNSHISYIVSKASKRIHLVRECRKAHLPVEVGLTTYTTKIRTLLDYACSIWGGLPQYLAMELQTVQDRCLRILALPKDTLEPLDKRRDEFTKKDIERIIKNKNLNHLLQQSTKVNHSYSLRRKNTHQVHVPMSKTKRHKQSFVPRALGLLNGN
ncbi:putative RNA-directed DNA polymerase from transposon X-element [Exaiptasia diaphana]|nr:putative RNA-directed DNA polymerase from transposon X-element [Exaiptasia diaphana]